MTKEAWRILVVEDDPDGQEVVSMMLERLNVPIDIASDALEAEDFLFQSDRAYSAVIIDLALPGKNGWELLADIRSTGHTAEIPCIAVTAYHSSKLREEALTSGFNAYFSKPIDSTSFARELEAIL
jgi:CheY-like chemotaxis protein